MNGFLVSRFTWRSATLVMCEGLLIAGAIAAVLHVRLGVPVWHSADAGPLVGRLLLMTLICQACLYYRDLYEFRLLATRAELIPRVLQSTAASAVVFAALSIFALCLPSKVYKRARKQLRRLRRAAGEARDWDVFLMELREREQQEAAARQRAEQGQQQEAAARRQAEAEIERLRRELERLRKQD